MLSIPDMAILGAAALLLFGPEQLPRVMRKAGMVMRDVQNTSQSFIREMERAADDYEPPKEYTPASSPPSPLPDDMFADVTPVHEAVPSDPVFAATMAHEPAEPAPEPPPSPAAQPAPQGDHPTHV